MSQEGEPPRAYRSAIGRSYLVTATAGSYAIGRRVVTVEWGVDDSSDGVLIERAVDEWVAEGRAWTERVSFTVELYEHNIAISVPVE